MSPGHDARSPRTSVRSASDRRHPSRTLSRLFRTPAQRIRLSPRGPRHGASTAGAEERSSTARRDATHRKRSGSTRPRSCRSRSVKNRSTRRLPMSTPPYRTPRTARQERRQSPRRRERLREGCTFRAYVHAAASSVAVASLHSQSPKYSQIGSLSTRCDLPDEVRGGDDDADQRPGKDPVEAEHANRAEP